STSCLRCHRSVLHYPSLLRPLPALLVNPQDRPCKTPCRQTPPWRLWPGPRNHRSPSSSAWLFSSLVTSPKTGRPSLVVLDAATHPDEGLNSFPIVCRLIANDWAYLVRPNASPPKLNAACRCHGSPPR